MFKNSLNFFNQVKQEFNKITWTPKKQAMQVSGIVFVMVFITAFYFFVLDWILSSAVGFLLNLGS
ncbi:MAG: preprotein translocase subunit SecE [Alphaproteobacteria bacterium]|jgi:preprotein translocase subunit SecE|nr:preprotein translocase subunit SecE [Alphaproteobacteria bacterium]